jgi:hypothetical protein
MVGAGMAPVLAASMNVFSVGQAERCYERYSPGETIHIDIKRFRPFQRVGHRIIGDPSGSSKSRGAGWDFVHVCIDDHSRVAFTEIKPDETAGSAAPFSKAL